MTKQHHWKHVYDGSYAIVAQCAGCHIVKVRNFADTADRYFHRGEQCEAGRDFDEEGCYGDPFPPMPLREIRELHSEQQSPQRLLWLILHYNAPITHVETIMQGLLELAPITRADIRAAHEHNVKAGRAMLEEIMRTANGSGDHANE